jgi:hypothetical protein
MNNFTITAWAKFRGTTVSQAYAVTADNLQHAFEQVFAFMAKGFYADSEQRRFIMPERVLISQWEQN